MNFRLARNIYRSSNLHNSDARNKLIHTASRAWGSNLSLVSEIPPKRQIPPPPPQLISRNYSKSPSILLASTTSSNADVKNETNTSKKNILQQMWERYSVSGQQMRIDRAERLFRAAEYHAKNP